MAKTICVFCASTLGNHPIYESVATELGQTLAARGYRMVYGGGGRGLMGVVAETALTNGAYVIGVLPYGLVQREGKQLELSELHMVESMHERKAKMSDFADAYVALPGGYGTFEELLEVTTWAQLGIHRKPIIAYNINGYYDPILQMVERGIAEGFIIEQSRSLIRAASTIPEIFELIENYEPTEPTRRWLTRDQI